MPYPSSMTVKPPGGSSVQLRPHIWVTWAAIASILLSATESDPDLWGHVRFGLDWWRSGLSTLDPYSFTQDKPWVNHEWLSEAAMAAAYWGGGGVGLIVLKVLLLGAVLALLGRRLRGATALVITTTLTLALVCLLPISLTVRPQLWSVVGLALLVTQLDPPAPPNAWRIAATACLFMLWANLHGGWITGAAVMCAFAAIRICRDRKAAIRWIALVGISLFATLINPYGLGLWRFLALTVRSSRPDISEWQAVRFTFPPSPDWIGILAPLSIALLLSLRKCNRPPFEVWGVIVLLAMASVRVSRVGGLMVPACLLLLAPYVVEQWGGLGRLWVRPGGASILFAAPVAIIVVAAAGSASGSLSCIPSVGAWAPDREAASHLQGASGRLWTSFNWGEYVIWHFGPNLQVSIDGRRETVYSESVLRMHRDFEQGDPAATAAFTSLSPAYVWLPSTSQAARHWLENNAYRIDVDTGKSFVAVRSDLPRLPKSTGALSACFP